ALKQYPSRKAYVLAYLKDANVQLQLRAHVAKATFTIADAPTVDGQSVSAFTTLGDFGPVTVGRTLEKKSSGTRTQVVLHEAGHQLNLASLGGPVHDDKAAGPFPSGRLFLDTMAACLVEWAAPLLAVTDPLTGAVDLPKPPGF